MQMSMQLATALCCLLAPMAAHAETRCGWLSNPSPRNTMTVVSTP
jgi:hypothetical protein